MERRLNAEAKELVCGYQALELLGEFPALDWVTEP
jgi:hypothetical protein